MHRYILTIIKIVCMYVCMAGLEPSKDILSCATIHHRTRLYVLFTESITPRQHMLRNLWMVWNGMSEVFLLLISSVRCFFFFCAICPCNPSLIFLGLSSSLLSSCL